MNPGADRLPADVLVKIFSYLPCEDLVKSVQFVCTWWQQVSWEKQLWKYVTYQPDGKNENVIQMLKLSPQLRSLNLIIATIDNDLIQFITDSCPNLEHLHITWESIYYNSRITNTRPVSQIKMLNLHWDLDSSLDFLYLDSAFPNLESLSIGPMRFNTKDLEHFLQKKQNTLHTLSIACCAAGDQLCVLPCLSVCTKLRNLCLYGMCKKIRSWKKVGHFPNISHLTLYDFVISSVNNSSPVFCSFPNITSLVLQSVEVTEYFFRIITHNCPQLQKLKLYFCIGPFVFLEDTLLARPLERLTHLYIHGTAYLSDGFIEHILWLMPGLIYLDFYQCPYLTTRCLKFICGISKLEVLKFDLCNKQPIYELTACDVKNKNLQLMFYNCPDVSYLDTLRQQKLRVYLTSYSGCCKEHFGGMTLYKIAHGYSWIKHWCL